MKLFMDEDFLLSGDTARQLYHEYAEKMPIVDYHCHIVPKEISDNIQFENITQIWLGADHYKWRLMRANGTPESYITGNAEDKDKFIKWAQTLERAIGNPLYHWSHLELKRYFGYEGVLDSNTANDVWDLCNKKLASQEMAAKCLIQNSKVTVLCTTDDPADTLEFHKEIAGDAGFKTRVLPAFRPDEAMHIEKPGFTDYLKKLSKASNIQINNFESLCEAIKNRMEYFHIMGCKTSDHGMEFVMYYPASKDVIEAIFKKRLMGVALSRIEALQYKTAFLQFAAKEYHRLNWVMQLHYGVKRDNNTRLFQQIGANTGFDCIDDSQTSSAQLADFLNALDCTDQLPKTIVYSLNPIENTAIDSVIGCFNDAFAVNKIQHGSAWWFNDHKPGMKEQLYSLANTGLLSNFVGMLTDSRSFLSYTRHEYFRRILCDMIGKWVDNGEYPKNMDLLGKMVQDISYNNCMRYFEF
ncbi:MAG: uxaC [Herbinix sp.]|nr:uxaC [Herbinix sp.]